MYIASLENYFNELGYAKSKVKEAIKDLEAWKVLIYRDQYKALAIFQGSDLDVNELVASTVDAIKDGIDWVAEIQSTKHVLATAHYHKKGTMRWADVTLLSERNISSVGNISEIPKDNEPFLYFFVPTSASTLQALHRSSNVHKRILSMIIWNLGILDFGNLGILIVGAAHLGILIVRILIVGILFVGILNVIWVRIALMLAWLPNPPERFHKQDSKPSRLSSRFQERFQIIFKIPRSTGRRFSPSRRNPHSSTWRGFRIRRKASIYTKLTTRFIYKLLKILHF